MHYCGGIDDIILGALAVALQYGNTFISSIRFGLTYLKLKRG
jgi:hypothetical protein